jgi:two-component system, LytTR family, response regulator
MLRVLIVDDEPFARDRIRRMLKAELDVEVVAECASAPEAAQAIRRHRPDVVFLDVQMPRYDGFDVLDALEGPDVPAVVFVTAFDTYAIRAFDAHAVDYLLKPFDAARFRTALRRARDRVEREPMTEARLQALRAELRADGTMPGAAGEFVERLLVRADGRVYFVRVADIDWIEGARNYVKLHAGRDVHVMRRSLTALATMLDPRRFARIHRSTIVNVDRIREMQPWFSGDYVVILQSGTKLRMTRNHRELIEAGRPGRWSKPRP